MPMKLLPCFYRIMGPAPTDRFSGRIIGLSGVPAFARLSAPLRNCTSHRTVQSISIPWSAHGHGLARRPDLRLRRSDAAHLRGRSHRSEEHTSELQSLMRISYAVFCLKNKKKPTELQQLIYRITEKNIQHMT